MSSSSYTSCIKRIVKRTHKDPNESGKQKQKKNKQTNENWERKYAMCNKYHLVNRDYGLENVCIVGIDKMETCFARTQRGFVLYNNDTKTRNWYARD